MKSKELREFFKAISSLNNAFTHYFFVWTQFNLDYAEALAASADENTSGFFAGNGFAPKHNVRLKELPEEHIKTNETLLEGIYILILTHFEDYTRAIHEFARQIDSEIVSLDQGDFEDDTLVIDKVLNRIGIKKENLSAEYYLTYDYLRLKRNRLVHKSSEKISRSIRELVGKYGKSLNEFWNEKLPKGLQGIDFTDKNLVDTLEFDILIDTLNVLRGTGAKIDEAVVEKLGVVEICKKQIVPDYFAETKIKPEKFTDKQIQKHFKGYCRTEYGLFLKDDLLKQISDDIA